MLESLNTDPSVALMAQNRAQSNNTMDRLRESAQNGNMEAIEKVAKDFEAVFLSEMLKPMFKDIKPDPLFGGGKSEKMFRDLMIQEYGKKMAETGRLGIADKVKTEIIRIQEEAQNNGL